MKYNIGDELFYVNPFVFVICKVVVRNIMEDDTGLYYITGNNAALDEHNLFFTVEEAKKYCVYALSMFYQNKRHEIDTRVPQLEGE